MPEELIDSEAWENVKMMVEPAFLVELIDVYLTDSVALIQQMRAAVAGSDAEGLRRAAHSLKSNSSTLGANHLAGLAREVEMSAKAGQFEGVAGKIDGINSEFTRLAPVLTELKHEC